MENNDKQNFIHTALYKGECEQILKQIPDKSVDLVIIDPPYDICTKGDKKGNTKIAINIKALEKEMINNDLVMVLILVL